MEQRIWATVGQLSKEAIKKIAKLTKAKSTIKRGHLVVDYENPVWIGSEKTGQQTKYLLVARRGDQLVQDETEVYISNQQFQALWPMTLGFRIEKVKHSITLDGTPVEIDVYRDTYENQAVIRVNEEDDFILPTWLGEVQVIGTEMSCDDSWIALHGWPDIE